MSILNSIGNVFHFFIFLHTCPSISDTDPSEHLWRERASNPNGDKIFDLGTIHKGGCVS